MPEPISATTAVTIITTAGKVSAFTALVTLVSTDTDMMMVLIVGVIGGFTYIGKEFVLEEFIQNPLKNILNIPFSMMMAISLTGIVFYGGKDGVNPHIKDLGVYIWIFLAFMAGMNYNRVTSVFSSTILAIVNIATEKWKNK